MPEVRIGVVGATGAVGTVTLELLAERGFENVRAFASARSAGHAVAFGERELVVEEATPERLAAGGLAIVLAEQNIRFAARCVDRFVALAGGRVVMRGTARELDDPSRLMAAYLGHS